MSDAINTLATGQAKAAPSVPAVETHAAPVDTHQLHARLYTLAQICTDALIKSVQHYQTEKLWLVGSMPSCAEQVDLTESQTRAFLAHSQLSSDQIAVVTRILRDTNDLRVVARCARHTAQISWILRQETQGKEIETLLKLVRCVGDSSVAVARKSTLAIAAQNSQAATWAALRYRAIDAARRDAERDLTQGSLVVQFSPTQRRLTRAAVWYVTIAGECMARLAARTAQPL